jgi:hypothetical protein
MTARDVLHPLSPPVFARAGVMSIRAGIVLSLLPFLHAPEAPPA